MSFETDTDLPGEILYFARQTGFVQDEEIMISRFADPTGANTLRVRRPGGG